VYFILDHSHYPVAFLLILTLIYSRQKCIVGRFGQ